MKLTNKKLYTVLPLFLVLCGTQSYGTELKTKVQKESYSIGASTGNYISNQIFNQVKLGAKVDMSLVVKGFEDALKNKLDMNDSEIIGNLNSRAEFMNKVQKKEHEKLLVDNAKKEKAFLEKNKKRAMVKVTKSGLQYEVLKEGTGKAVHDENIVVMNYKGTLADGYVFDDTYKRKAPAHLSMINVVDGLKEGLKLMKEGAKYKLYVPSKLGYGEVQMRDIPPNSVLIFEVELMKVLKPGAFKKKLDFEKMAREKNIKKKTLEKNPHSGTSGTK